MNLAAALTHTVGALNALPGDAPPACVVQVRQDALRALVAYCEDNGGAASLDGVAASLWAWAGTAEVEARHAEPQPSGSGSANAQGAPT